MISTCLIGEDSLLIQCGEILLNRGHTIKLVISPARKVQLWAEKSNIPCLQSINKLGRNYSTKFDFIFSIINSQILPSRLLQLAQRAAINYHDSLLPKYAGLHATSWAILNREKKHGITWHIMNQTIDQGEIAKQVTFPIYPEDTAFTLNLRCYEFAIQSFQELIEDIENQKLSLKKQELEKRTYYGASHEIPNLGYIDWPSFSAEEIERMHRALTFGNYHNSLGTLKLLSPAGDYWVVSKLELTNNTSPNNAEQPGTIISIDDNSLIIFTITNPIKITELSSPFNDQLKIEDLVRDYNLKKGFRFNSLNKIEINKLKKPYIAALKYEKFWSGKLLNLSQHSIFSREETLNEKEFTLLPYDINLKQIFPNKKLNLSKGLFITAILIYLYRLNNQESISAFLTHENFPKIQNKYGSLISYLLPINLSDLLNASLHEALAEVEKKITRIKLNKFYLTDIAIRNPLFEHKSIEPNIVIGFNDFKIESLPSKCILFFQIDEEKGSIKIYCRFDINTKNYIKELIVNCSQHITNILIHLTNNPHISAATFSFLPAHEEHKLLYDFGKGSEKLFPPLSIISMLKKQVSLRPNHIAVVTNNKSVSYQELWDTSEKVAAFIKSKKIPEQSLLGIFLERNIETLTVILGILKANLAYVPLDTKYPLSRISYIMSEAQVTTILTESTLLKKLTTFFQSKNQNINVFSVQDILKHHLPVSPIESNNFSEKLIYVMFTSGSTGSPKGVMVTEKNVINYCHWFLENTRFNHNSIMDFSASIAFDLSVPCSIAPLLVGGTIAICTEKEKINPEKYLSHLQENRVTHIEITPGYMHLLLEFSNKLKLLSNLRWVLLGADTVSKTDVMKWLSFCPHHQLVNEYGPTETTVAVTSYLIDPNSLPDEASVPIGQPGFNTGCYILDKLNNLCPIGMLGELHISGTQVSRGYLNNPILTQQKFITSNLKGIKETLYKTGDIAYWLPDGNLQFVGRNDHQTKIMGYRVETAEIEAALSKIPGIDQAIVMQQTQKPNHKFLKAYLVSNIPFKYYDEIKKFLASYLPNYMIPKEFCLIDSIPLKENEKIDYHALSNQPSTLLISRSQKIMTVDVKVQEEILCIWQTIFNNPRINIRDNFFDIGGDSLIALQILEEINKNCHIEIPLVYLFKYPNIELLSNKIQEISHSNDESTSFQDTVIPLCEGEDKTPLFLIHPVGGSIFWYQPLASLLQGKYTIYGIQDPNLENHTIPFESLEDMAKFYLEAINEIYQGESFRLGGASFGATVAFEMANQLIRAGKKVEFLGLFDGWMHYPESLVHDESSKFLTKSDRNFHQLNAEKKEKLLRLTEKRRQLLSTYRLPRLNVEATLFKATELWPAFEEIDEHYNGWFLYVYGRIHVYRIPGNHETMFFTPNVEKLSIQIEKCLVESATYEESEVPAYL